MRKDLLQPLETSTSEEMMWEAEHLHSRVNKRMRKSCFLSSLMGFIILTDDT